MKHDARALLHDAEAFRATAAEREALSGDAPLPQETLRTIYLCGLALAAGKSAVLKVGLAGGSCLSILVESDIGGIVGVSCGDPTVCEQFRTTVGFRLLLNSSCPNRA